MSSTFENPWVADQGDGTYCNPILFADYSDPDVIRVGDNFYMVASSFNCTPGIPILRSQDLVNWTIINHVFDRLPYPCYDEPAHGKGAWAPSIRYHAGKYWVFFSTPDEGIFMSTAADPAQAWSPLKLVKEAKGWIDPCPFWDDDGQAYLVHAFAKSRAGIKSILHLCRMKPDGTELLDEGRLVFDGTQEHPTIEGPKLYKHNGYYYIFAPAGGVRPGWQTVLRAKNVSGPYEDKIVMAQGNTDINGPHQGGWVELESGEGWFVHFQDRGAYGRITHLQPVCWIDDWPLIGQDRDGDSIGEPVAIHAKPNVGKNFSVAVPQTSDEFDSVKLGLQWQWHANPQPAWMSLSANPGKLRLYAMPAKSDLLQVPNLLLQKFPAPTFTVTSRITFQPEREGEQVGLVIIGKTLAFVGLQKQGANIRLIQSAHSDAGQVLIDGGRIDRSTGSFYLRVSVGEGAVCRFSYSADGHVFKTLGEKFQACAGVWIGAKVGLFCINPSGTPSQGFADCHWFRVAASDALEQIDA
ncbi:MAG: glycoside hydrolase 43 family protein [Chloroflexi bacterium]|nr:glycoside hydrolase 43 family protein [Chloroflexota bacterium]